MAKDTFFNWALRRFTDFKTVYPSIIWQDNPGRTDNKITYQNVTHNVKVVLQDLPKNHRRSREVLIDGIRQPSWDLVERV